MNKSTLVLTGLVFISLGVSGYEIVRTREVEGELNAAKLEVAKQGRRPPADDKQIRDLQIQLRDVNLKIDQLTGYLNGVAPLVSAALQGGPNSAQGIQGLVFTAGTAPGSPASSDPPIPANQVAAVHPFQSLSPEEMAHRIDVALQRTPEPLSPVTAQDLANMPTSYEWGTGTDRRMMRLNDAGTYLEVYPDGSYSVLPILGHTEVNGSPGVIATKDDGSLEIFVPDKGGRMVHLIRSAGPQSSWVDYRDMLNVE